MHTGEVVGLIVTMMAVFGLPVTAFIVHRVLKHQEHMEMIKHGFAPGTVPFANNNKAFTQAQKAWTPPPAAGDPVSLYSYQLYVAAQNQLRKGVSIALIGLAIFIGLSFIDPGHPGPWLLGGLIPMFVGIAQVINALMAGARFGIPVIPPAPYQTSAPPPPPGQPSQPRDVTPGPYAYRPGSTTELEPPASPPDRR